MYIHVHAHVHASALSSVTTLILFLVPSLYTDPLLLEVEVNELQDGLHQIKAALSAVLDRAVHLEQRPHHVPCESSHHAPPGSSHHASPGSSHHASPGSSRLNSSHVTSFKSPSRSPTLTGVHQDDRLVVKDHRIHIGTFLWLSLPRHHQMLCHPLQSIGRLTNL